MDQVKNDIEEKANAITHGLGLLFATIALPILVIKALDCHTGEKIKGLLVYTGCFFILYLSSTLYHSSRTVKWRKFYRKLDHISIFLMIAGSYTPFIIGFLYGNNKWGFLIIMWTIVLFGAIFKIFFTGRYDRLSVIIYLAMGWMLIFQAEAFFTRIPSMSLWMIVIGGAAYTLGTYFYSRDDRPYYHAIWHLFCLGGSIFHYIAIWLVTVTCHNPLI